MTPENKQALLSAGVNLATGNIPGFILSAAPSIYQMITGNKQKKMANNLKQSNYIPDSLKEVETMARAGANATRLPGQDAMESQIERGTANAVGNARRASRSGTQLLENIGEINAQEGAARMDLNKMLADFQTGERRNLQGVLGQKAQVELRNKDAYDAAKRNLLETSQMNTYGALSGLASAGINNLGTGGNNSTTQTDAQRLRDEALKKAKAGGFGITGIPNTPQLGRLHTPSLSNFDLNAMIFGS